MINLDIDCILIVVILILFYLFVSDATVSQVTSTTSTIGSAAIKYGDKIADKIADKVTKDNLCGSDPRNSMTVPWQCPYANTVRNNDAPANSSAVSNFTGKFTSGYRDKFCNELDQSCDLVMTNGGIQNINETFATDDDEIGKDAEKQDSFAPERLCSGGNYRCLPSNEEAPGCTPTNVFSGGQLPCNNVGVFWIAYSRMIGDQEGWAINDANGWGMPIETARQLIYPGDSLCWNGQPVGKIVALAAHKNVPLTTFVILDRRIEINLQGQLVAVRR